MTTFYADLLEIEKNLLVEALQDRVRAISTLERQLDESRVQSAGFRQVIRDMYPFLPQEQQLIIGEVLAKPLHEWLEDFNGVTRPEIDETLDIHNP